MPPTVVLETLKATQGFLEYKSADCLSASAIESYERYLIAIMI